MMPVFIFFLKSALICKLFSETQSYTSAALSKPSSVKLFIPFFKDYLK